MPNQLDITSGQELATQRHDLAGVVYLLSGTLLGRAEGVDDAPFKWGTENVVAPLGVSGTDVTFEAYLREPTGIRRAMSFDPRGGPSDPAIRVPVYNLAFAHAESLLAAITDGDFSWENTNATLRVGYLQPGQTAADLAAADWTPVITDGFFGAPQDVQLDAFNLVLYGRGASRNQALTQQVIPDPSESTSTSSQGVDKADVGRPYPICVGRPDTWFRPPTTDMRTRGFTVSGYSAGDTIIQMRPLTSGVNMLKTGGVQNTTRVMVHNRTPAYLLTSGFADVTYDVDKDLLTFVLSSGLNAAVPRGAYVQEYAAPDGYRWGLAGYKWLASGIDLEGSVGFAFSDGRVVPADLSRWPFEISVTAGGVWDDDITTLVLPIGTTDDPNVPAFFEPNDPNSVEVTTQPTFTSNQSLTGKDNYGTGGAGVGNANARDGNAGTAMLLALAEAKTITYNDAPSPFANDDTTASTLHVMNGGGTITYTDATGSTTFGTAGGLGTFRFTQASARDYNETVRCVGTSAGSVVEVWWEHDATTTEVSTRTGDTEVGTGVSGEVGEALEFVDVVFRCPPDHSGDRLLQQVTNVSGALVANPWVELENTSTTNQPVGYPAAAMAGLQSLLLGDEGRLDSIAQDAYTEAHAKHVADNIRWNFVIMEPIPSWAQLEQELASQSRTGMFYGPSGHEMVYQETVSGYDLAPIIQDFRMEGLPGANAAGGNGPVMERTLVSEIRNRVIADYSPDHMAGGAPQASLEASDADSVALFGERADPRGRFHFWAHSPDTGNPHYDVAVSVSGVAGFMATRYAFAQTRFRLRTSWIAHGIDRGSIVRLAYSVGEGIYRNVRCEVEDIKVAPTDAEQVDLVVRSVSTPKFGLGGAFTWPQIFVDAADSWTTRITGAAHRWDQYWNA